VRWALAVVSINECVVPSMDDARKHHLYLYRSFQTSVIGIAMFGDVGYRGFSLQIV